MTNDRNHYDLSLDHLAAVEAFTAHLRDAYKSGTNDRGVIADLHTAIGRGLKIANTHALLHIGATLDAIRDGATR